jgi:hypothetical protein
MSARQQGRVTTQQTVSTIDDLTLTLGSVELEPIASLREIPQLLHQLGACVRLFELAQRAEAAEMLPFQSIQRQLQPVTDMVVEPNIIPPPFSADLRQRIGYATAQLAAMKQRLQASKARIPGKVVRAEASGSYLNLADRWSSFRHDPSLSNLESLENAAHTLRQLYQILGIRADEPRVKGLHKLCDLLERASDRDGELDDVPSLLREVTTKANELCRPTVAQHHEWVVSVL